MKKVVMHGLVWVVIGFAMFAVGMARGHKLTLLKVYRETLRDLKIANERNEPQMREYLKSRYYYYSNRLGIRGTVDFGPIDEALLSGYPAGKDLTTYKFEYEQYHKRTTENSK
jgi:hypothetical protein